ncbi:MAG: hypothetical protein JO278_09260 [Dyella sp.]|nr:hypothetical protein [Dyella sp.]
MARIFLLLAIVLVILWWLRNRASERHAAERPAQQRRASAGNSDQDSEPMVQCAHCGVHLPRGDAIAWHGLHYCRRSHLPETPGEGDNGARP